MNKHTLSLISIFYTSTAVWSVGQIFFGEIAGISLIFRVAIGLAPSMWLTRDAKLRGWFLPHVVHPFVLAFWVIVVPVYVIWTRKWRGLKLVVFHALLTLLLTIVLNNAALYLIWGPRVF